MTPEPHRLPIRAQLVLSAVGETESGVRERAGELLAARDAGGRLVELLRELLGDELEITSAPMVDLRADWPLTPAEPHVARHDGTVWILEDSEWVELADRQEAEYLTGSFSAHWSGPEDRHEPGPDGQPLADILEWARWRAPRVVVQVPGLGRYWAGEIPDADLSPMPADGLAVSRRPSPSSVHVLRTEADTPILWDVRVTAPSVHGAAAPDRLVRAFVAAIAAESDVIDLLSWVPGVHPATGYAAVFLLRHATYAQCQARAAQLVEAAFAAIAAAMPPDAAWVGLGFEVYPFDGDEDARRDPPGRGRAL